MRLVRLILLLTFFCAMFSGCARETTAEHSANQYAAQELAARSEEHTSELQSQ